MDYIQVALDQLETGVPDSKMLEELIEGHKPDKERMMALYERYKTSGVPILNRRFEDENKVNNKLNNDFFSDIVDTKVGYFAGRPISYMLDKEKEGYEKLAEAMDDFHKRNNLPDLDSETSKMAAVTGQGSRLLYIDTEGNERVVNIPPWEAIYLQENGIEEPEYAMRYYEIKRKNQLGKWEEVTRVEWYDKQSVTFWVQKAKGGTFILDPAEAPTPHNFDFVPLIGFPNNEELQGDCEKVLALIDGYDRTISDVNSEIEQFRLAYMATYGVTVDDEVLLAAKRTGAFSFPDKDCKMEFITKMLEDAVVEHHLDRLEDNIMRFAKSVNMADEQFSGTSSGVSLRYKMLGLENKCITAERKFTTSLRSMFKVLATAWEKRGIKLDYMDIDFQFTRNFPLNLLDEAQTTVALKGQVSDRTRLSLLTFVEDVDSEMEQMEMESVGDVDLDSVVMEDEEEE